MALRKRDLFLLCVSAAAVLFSFSGDYSFRSAMMDAAGYSLHHAFTIPIDTTFYANRHFPSEAEQLPPPIITDLDGDGRTELVVATADRKVRLYDLAGAAPGGGYEEEMADVHHFGQVLKELPIKFSASTIPQFGVDHDRMPIALQTGYVSPMNDTARTQVVVVLTEGLNVLCYSHELELLWETTIDASEMLSRESFHREAAILIAPIPVRVGDDGVVVVSIREAPADNPTYADRLIHEHMETVSSEDPDEVLEAVRLEKMRGKERNDMELFPDDEDTADKKENLQHYSLYAFASHNGAARWRHAPGDFEKGSPVGHEDEHYSSMLPEHTFKLHVFKADEHAGELPWEYYKENVLEQLPHNWMSRHDSALSIAHFERRRGHGMHASGRSSGTGAFGQAGARMPSSSSLLLSNIHSSLLHVAGVPVSSQGRAHSELEHVEKPNVVVAHTADGIEVVHLHTGRPLCSLELPNKKGVYADVNADGVVDHIQTLVGREEKEKRCYGWVTSGVPPTDTLTRVDICEPHGFQLLNLRKHKKRRTKIETGPIALLDRKPYAHRGQGFDALYLVSSGDLSSFDPSGKQNWKISTAAEWEPWSWKSAQKANAFMETAFRPTLHEYSMEVFGESRHVVGVGRETISVVSQDGYEAATAAVCGGVPMQNALTVGDFNDDGVNDFVLVTSDSLCGYRLERHTASVFFPALVCSLVIIIAVLSISSPQTHLATPRGPGRKKRRFDHASNTHVE